MECWEWIFSAGVLRLFRWDCRIGGLGGVGKKREEARAGEEAGRVGLGGWWSRRFRGPGFVSRLSKRFAVVASRGIQVCRGWGTEWVEEGGGGVRGEFAARRLSFSPDVKNTEQRTTLPLLGWGRMEIFWSDYILLNGILCKFVVSNT